MTEIEFRALAAQGYNRIPLLAECFCDLDTPLSLYLKLTDAAARRNSFLLESVVGGERFGRYSFIGLPARTLLRADGERIEVLEGDQIVETAQGDPLEFVRAFNARFRVALRPGLPRFCGGLAGYFAYDVVRHIEPRLGPCRLPDPLAIPDVLLLVVDEVAIVDNVSGKLYLLVYADPSQPEAYLRGQNRLHELRARLRGPMRLPDEGAGRAQEGGAQGMQPRQAAHDARSAPHVKPLDQSSGADAPSGQAAGASLSGTAVVRRDFAKADYLQAVLRAKEYITAGDLMQVQVGQCLRRPFTRAPLTLYRALRSINPSPYMYYYDFGDFHVVGASPEILVRQQRTEDGTTVTIRPLAGTRPRGLTPQQDEALATELLADPKERAEHLMLIDLARNDIGRIAKTASVRVTDQMTIEKYSHVMHVVSNVEGKLQDGLDNIDVLRASFPAGTLTGAPKVRAMQLIDELEPTKRGLYGGACGYLSWSGEMDLAIAIRTGVLKDGTLHVQAAAGIVHDSVPESEWQETENKARALIRAAELADRGLD